MGVARVVPGGESWRVSKERGASETGDAWELGDVGSAKARRRSTNISAADA
jgi:hypothetical protein